MHHSKIDIEFVKSLLHYNSDTGELIWKVNRSRGAKVGTQAGWIKEGQRPYRRVKIKGKSYQAHRLCWAIHYGEDPGDKVVDHINGDYTDNRIANLRLCSVRENTWNNRKAKGYCWCKRNKKWRAMIWVDGKSVGLGSHDTEEQAREAYEQATVKYRGVYSIMA